MRVQRLARLFLVRTHLALRFFLLVLLNLIHRGVLLLRPLLALVQDVTTGVENRAVAAQVRAVALLAGVLLHTRRKTLQQPLDTLQVPLQQHCRVVLQLLAHVHVIGRVAAALLRTHSLHQRHTPRPFLRQLKIPAEAADESCVGVLRFLVLRTALFAYALLRVLPRPYVVHRNAGHVRIAQQRGDSSCEVPQQVRIASRPLRLRLVDTLAHLLDQLLRRQHQLSTVLQLDGEPARAAVRQVALDDAAVLRPHDLDGMLQPHLPQHLALLRGRLLQRRRDVRRHVLIDALRQFRHYALRQPLHVLGRQVDPVLVQQLLVAHEHARRVRFQVLDRRLQSLRQLFQIDARRFSVLLRVERAHDVPRATFGAHRPGHPFAYIRPRRFVRMVQPPQPAMERVIRLRLRRTDEAACRTLLLEDRLHGRIRLPFHVLGVFGQRNLVALLLIAQRLDYALGIHAEDFIQPLVERRALLRRHGRIALQAVLDALRHHDRVSRRQLAAVFKLQVRQHQLRPSQVALPSVSQHRRHALLERRIRLHRSGALQKRAHRLQRAL